MLKVFPNGLVILSATKNQKRRRFALDQLTLAVLPEQKARAESRCEALGVDLASDAFVWSQAADHSEPWRPDRVSGAFTGLRNQENLRHVCLNDVRHSCHPARRRGSRSLVVGRVGLRDQVADQLLVS